MRILIALFLTYSCTLLCAQNICYRFSFSEKKSVKKGYIKVSPDMLYTSERGYGYDFVDNQRSTSYSLQSARSNSDSHPSSFYFSVNVPDGNYRVNVVLGNRHAAGITTLRGESRRLFYERVVTKQGERKTCTFTINKRSTLIEGEEHVRIKKRELGKLNWDNKLTIEIAGPSPQVAEITIERIETATTVFLCGNSVNISYPFAS